jgi:hypothetical protein
MSNIIFSIAVAISLSAASCLSVNESNQEVPSVDSLNLDSLKLSLDSLKVKDSIGIDYIYEND